MMTVGALSVDSGQTRHPGPAVGYHPRAPSAASLRTRRWSRLSAHPLHHATRRTCGSPTARCLGVWLPPQLAQVAGEIHRQRRAAARAGCQDLSQTPGRLPRRLTGCTCSNDTRTYVAVKIVQIAKAKTDQRPRGQFVGVGTPGSCRRGAQAQPRCRTAANQPRHPWHTAPLLAPGPSRRRVRCRRSPSTRPPAPSAYVGTRGLPTATAAPRPAATSTVLVGLYSCSLACSRRSPPADPPRPTRSETSPAGGGAPTSANSW